jgi:hypothetical protein
MILKQLFNCRQCNLTFNEKMLQGRRKTSLDKCSTASPIRGTHKLHTLPPVRKVILLVYCSYNEMAHAETIIHLSFCEMDVSEQFGGSDSSADYSQPSCAHQLVAFVLCWMGYVLQLCDTYWILTPYSSVPLHFPSHASQCAISY